MCILGRKMKDRQLLMYPICNGLVPIQYRFPADVKRSNLRLVAAHFSIVDVDIL